MKEYLASLILNSQDQYITYEEFMNAVLYHPSLGYYMKDKPKIGREGDFITTTNVLDIFGSAVCKWFSSKIHEEGPLLPNVCEIGGGNGRFAKAFIDEWNRHCDLPLQYTIIETSPYHRRLQRDLLSDIRGVQILESLDHISEHEGMFFSNELFDALPVRVIEKNGHQLLEVVIGLEAGELVERKVVLENQRIIDFIKESGIKLVNHQRFEIPLAMDDLLRELANKLKKGYMLTIDYGYTNLEWQEEAHRNGSLRGYYQHKMVTNPLLYPGDMDLTTHIHFDRLIDKGKEWGLHFISFLRQDQFLLEAGILQELEDNFDPNPFSERSKRNRAIRSLVMPSGMSGFFHALVQKK
ncbi:MULTISPECIES: class I SAM-dependent methyltransferase [unclassified Bacillus (in: firmicutes)]|uniref:class I SAM-dependent methyltransferase n=1 Tax=unclassified Bacillus (in: firmicutes) TaxID=185979 RepID=UPI000B87DB13|nr:MULTISPECIES: SAM-dependent methyltransferase [unclassified Bacillus (in: firmicutes)]